MKTRRRSLAAKLTPPGQDRWPGDPDFTADNGEDVDAPIGLVPTRREFGDIVEVRAVTHGAGEKDSNPKQAMGDAKLPLYLVPATMECFAALAFLEGGLKYGAHNFKAIGVRASTYYAAAGRHLKKWWSGEWADKKTGIPHLASALACLAIIADATVSENLTDDRPPSTKVSEWIDGNEDLIARVKALYQDKNPRHYTIADPVRHGG